MTTAESLNKDELWVPTTTRINQAQYANKENPDEKENSFEQFHC